MTVLQEMEAADKRERESRGEMTILRIALETTEKELEIARREIDDWKLAASMEPQRIAEALAIAFEEAAQMGEWHQAREGQVGPPIRALAKLPETLVVLPCEHVEQIREALKGEHETWGMDSTQHHPSCRKCAALALLPSKVKS